MNLSPLSIALLFLCFIITFTVGRSIPTCFTGGLSINCGSVGTSAARNGREWLGDVQPDLSSLLQISGFSTVSTVIHELTSADPVPHKTAIISRSQFSYAFQVNPGQKIIRLHFNPTPYNGLKGLKDLFTVEAGSFTLLGNFSASLTANALGVNTFAKEFCLNIQESRKLTITFSPESSQSLDTYVFINGIEIISVPTHLSYFLGGDKGLQVVGRKSLVYVDDSTALEIIHRLNIKHDPDPSTGVSDDMFPKWATQRADKLKNSTWKIPVEVGFRYLIRLHFSEIGHKIAGIGDRIFKVFINEMIAHTNADILRARDQNNILLYSDYMVMLKGLKRDGKRDLLITFQSYYELMDGHGVLAGFEIVKLSNPDNSLASPNPLPLPQHSPSWTIRIALLILCDKYVTATVFITIISLLSFVVPKLPEIPEASSTEEENKPSAKAERLCRRFSLDEIQLATRNFNDGLLIGRGGFGKVYKGLIDNGQKSVAVKRLTSYSMQGAREFLTEIETLSELRHVNLVSLIGYCNEHKEMILVYDYMAGGTLADQLYKLPRERNTVSSLTWKQRLNICIGAGRGLDYLHTGHGVIHRDIKASNILVDEYFIAKVSDFGLAKADSGSTSQTHINTNIRGTKGYLDPHYINTNRLTRKSDTYAFGVVLFELLCGRRALDPGLPEDEWILTKWARDKISKGEVEQIVSSNLREEISPKSLKTFVGVAQSCLHDEPRKRPTMSSVVVQLEFALEQQESKQDASDDIRPSTSNDGIDVSRTAQPTMATLHTQNLRFPPKEQTNSKVVSAELPPGTKHGRKATSNKPSRHWPWNAFWNRAKPSSRTNDLLISDTGRSAVKEPDSGNIQVAKSPARGITVDNSVEYLYEELANATNDFSIVYQIGESAFGSVYYAELRGVKAAIKKMDMQASREFFAELKVLTHVHHLNLVHLIGYCVKGSLFLVFEYIENGNLSHHLRGSGREPLPWSTRIQIALDAARGLEYIHEHTVPVYVHRDIKPANILIDKNFHGKVADFGLAKLTKAESGSLPTRTIVGTFGYMPPEYAQYGDVSPNVDVYAFGVVIYQLISAKEAIFKENGSSAFSRALVDVFEEILCKPDPSEDLRKLVDPRLGDGYPLDSVLKAAQLARACIHQNPQLRPSMRSVVVALGTLSSSTDS